MQWWNNYDWTFGNWEVFLPAFDLNGYPFVAVTQTQKNKEVKNFLIIFVPSQIFL